MSAESRFYTQASLLARSAETAPQIPTKSGLMLGLGESQTELRTALADLRAAGVRILTLGQYLQPSKKHLPIARYVTPEEFIALKAYGLSIGFKWVESGPLVRSSYHAAEQVRALSVVHRRLYGQQSPEGQPERAG